MRFFEKISFKQFEKDITSDRKLYEEYTVPKRATEYSAGYDFIALQDYVIKKHETLKIPTGIKAQMNNGEVLLLVIRSSIGFKYNVRMCNQVGVIDKDYYNNNENEGHIFIKLQNEGEEDFVVKKNNKIVQGIFIKYLTTDNEEKINIKRVGGIGSTTI